MAKRPYSQSVPDTALLIRQERLAAGMTQEELAEILNTSAVTVGRYETGDRQVTVTRLLQIADALGVPPSRLIKDGDGLTDDERDMLAHLRANPIHRKILLSTLETLKDSIPPMAAE
tara:strand:+ start:46199 stop:46549 length:351 start_codon:yes stop_codon:yes gene_type:complete